MNSIYAGRFRPAILHAALVLLALSTALGCSGAVREVETTPDRVNVVEADRGAATGHGIAGEPQAEGSPQGIYHVVLPRQTLWRIARAYGKPVSEIADANGLDDPNRLSAGDALFIPGASAEIYVPPYTDSSAPEASTITEGGWTWPVAGGEVLSGFGAPRRSRTHRGLDIRGRSGQDVVAVRGGMVVFSGMMRGYGKTVIVDHGDGYRSLYGHNSRVLVLGGERVRRGQTIAHVGKTGNASTEHCHLEIHRAGVAVDPLLYVAQARRDRR